MDWTRSVVLLMAITLCACEKDKPSDTPVADLWIRNQGAYADQYCGGVFDAVCEDEYFADFLTALSDQYNLPDGALKDCELTPEVCDSEREAETYFRRYF